MKRAQSAIEFMIIVSAALLFLSAFLVVFQNTSAEKARESRNLEVKEIALTVQGEINLAYGSSDGYERDFSLPERVSGGDYEVNLTEGLVYVYTTDEKIALALPVVNVSGNILKGSNTISKKNGIVYLNE